MKFFIHSLNIFDVKILFKNFEMIFFLNFFSVGEMRTYGITTHLFAIMQILIENH
jgi:hypothetical protein